MTNDTEKHKKNTCVGVLGYGAINKWGQTDFAVGVIFLFFIDFVIDLPHNPHG
jgi:hypothetical protein